MRDSTSQKTQNPRRSARPSLWTSVAKWILQYGLEYWPETCSNSRRMNQLPPLEEGHVEIVPHGHVE